ncbi:MAG TPA: ATP-binding protein [Vicinamibacterales bacterium]|nr:ATP-binding protein [Vicinamibacterales bacterium]
MGTARQTQIATPDVTRRAVKTDQPVRPVGATAAPAPVKAPLGDRYFRHLVLNLRTGVLAIDTSGAIAAINDMAYRVLGLPSRPNDVGRPFAEVLHDCPEVVRVLQQAFSEGDLPNRAEMRLRKTGRSVGYTLSHIQDDERQTIGATLFFKDLTRVEQIEERERLRDRLAALGEMAAAIAHEVKNPLASIEVMAGVLKRQLVNQGEALETLNDIIKEAKMANAIVVEVLEFVRPIQLQVERVGLEAVIKDSITLAEGKRRRGTITIESRFGEDVPELLADPHQLRQLFSNLLANAFEAMGGEGHVSVNGRLLPIDDSSDAVEPEPPQVIIEVRDSGPGISAEDLERIFSPFFTTKPQGTGLGLAIVRKVVDAHEGRIDAVSAPGRGATFRVTLPVVPSVRSMGER